MKNLYEKHLSKVLNTFDRLMNEYNYDEVVLYSGDVKYIHLDDNPYPFKVYTNFKYFAPVLNYPNSLISYRSGEKPKLFLFQKEDYWDSQPEDIEGFWTEYFDISYFSSLDKLTSNLNSDLKNTAFLGEDTIKFQDLNFKSFNDQKIIDFIHFNRSIKSDYEIECMRRANELASKAHLASKQAFLEGKSELETHLIYLNAINFKESEVPYSNIVAYDENAAILHYVDYNTKRTNAKSFLLDAGASYNGYHADITRTFVKEGHQEFNELIRAVNDSTLNIISKVEVGINYEELQEQMHKDVAKMLVDFKFMNISYDEIYDEGFTKIFCPAGVGHYIGLQVHDIGNYISDEKGTSIQRSKEHPFLRLRRDIQNGNVFTIEPGIYIIDQLLKKYYGNNKFNWDVINKFRPYGGIRVEDSVYINEAGIENLTRPHLKEIDKIYI